jgi:large subunit ribosomal protein L25
MKSNPLKVYPRDATGKGAARKLRHRGLIPAIFYGRDREPVLLSLNCEDLQNYTQEEEGTSMLFTLEIDENGELNNKLAVLKELQRDPIDLRFIHADLQEVFLDQKITATVALHFVGDPVGVEAGGVLQPSLRTLEVECLPTQIPQYVEVGVASLDIGDSLHVADLQLPVGVETVSSLDLAVVTVSPPTVEKVAPVAEEVAEEEAEAAEAEETAGEEKEETGE